MKKAKEKMIIFRISKMIATIPKKKQKINTFFIAQNL